ncbi:MAG TPA: CPBP family intramembrane glutamic endopeptidase [Anaerolineales bacterium]|nr:CPBP family intramembrane glutamic endopeptidase [Anaerolineales bacterium]
MKTLLGERLSWDWKSVTVIVISTLLLIINSYHQFTPDEGYDRIILYLVIPLLCVVLIFREDPRRYGLTFGDWKVGILLTAMGITVMAVILWFVAREPSMRAYYKSQADGLPWNTFLDLFGWEFLFRGFILFAFVRRFGAEGLWLQAVPFALAHIGKPEIETLSTIFGGFAFGWVAFRTRSFVYPFLIHWFIASFTIMIAAGYLG